MTSEEFAYLWLLALAGLAVLFMVPSIIAFRRGHPNRWPILAVNICLGGSGIGWFAALIWALHAVHRPGELASSRGGESGLNVFANDVHRVRLVGGAEINEGRESRHLTTATAVAEIERLSALRVSGHLSEAEFVGLKSAVLKRL